ncbi:hypothetical protein JTE90_027876 [Oedothorax gibbosus]|uniref:Gustatory receptor n=1 Tax=Oedothorax gibbosus TaxID=931172 RepID=A0AAV6U710_9ARAC|nr:hypothetical protein JTE90_027876 [Oedothorax gibbosus]
MVKYLLIMFNLYVTVFKIIILCSYPPETLRSFKVVSYAAMTMTMLVYRWVLCSRLDQFKDIVDSLRRVHVKKATKLWIYAFTIAYISMQVLVFYIKVVKRETPSEYKILGFSVQEPYASIIKQAYAFTLTIYIVVPINTFSILYVSVCQHMRFKILHFSDMISSRRGLKLNHLMQSYTRISNMVEGMDHAMSFPLFCHTLYSAGTMYFVLGLILYPADEIRTKELAHATIFFMMTLQSFAAMSVSASSISEASQIASKEIKSLLPDSLGSAFQLQTFISMTGEGGLGLTLWKIVPIRRSFIFGALGTFITYILLFQSTWPTPNHTSSINSDVSGMNMIRG